VKLLQLLLKLVTLVDRFYCFCWMRGAVNPKALMQLSEFLQQIDQYIKLQSVKCLGPLHMSHVLGIPDL